MKEKRSKKWWLSEGIFFTNLSQEPLIFRRRAGFATTDAVELYEKEHCEETVRELKDLGITLYITHCHKGFGLEAEKEEMEKAKGLADLCHKYGLRVGYYIRPDTLVGETFFPMEPRAKEWLQVNQDGRHPTYGGHQTFRFKPCFNREEYMRYLEGVVTYTVKEMKADLIHFDDLNLNPEPDSCHCEVCKEKFKKYLMEKYPSDAGRKERFGFTNLDYVEPPTFNLFNLPWDLEVIKDPVVQEWIAFRCHYQSETYARLSRLIRSINPECAVEYNATWCGVGATNTAWYAGVWFSKSAIHGDIFWTEEGNWAGVSEDGILISKIRTFKAAQTLRNIVFTYVGMRDEGQTRLLMAECMAYNPRCLGMIRPRPLIGSLSPRVMKYVKFYKENQDSFLDLEPIADVAVLRSYASLTHNNYSTYLSVLLFEQTMIQAKVPFSIIYDEHLGNLYKYKVLALANVESLSDGQMDQIKSYIKNGGGLVATDDTSLYDQWRRMRPNYGLSDVFKTNFTDEGPDVEKPIKETFGNGRVLYIPRISPSFTPPRPSRMGYQWIDSRYWMLPKNWKDLVDAVQWAAGEALSMRVKAPLTVTAELWRKANKQILLSLVNYRLKELIEDIEVKVQIPPDMAVRKVSLLSPDIEKGNESLSFKKARDQISFTIPRLIIYDLIAIELFQVSS